MAFCNESEMGKHDSNYNAHGRGANQEDISGLELFGWCKFEYKAVVYPRLPPHENVATVEEQMQEQ